MRNPYKYFKEYYWINLELGTHRDCVPVQKRHFQMWLWNLSKEFDIITHTHIGKKSIHKDYGIINYWGEFQEIGWAVFYE